MARGIVRISFNDDYGSRETARVRKVLEERGFDKLGTASYEGDGDLALLTEALREVLDILDGISGEATLDHLWIYLDAPG